jgi:hypothetical protein
VAAATGTAALLVPPVSAVESRVTAVAKVLDGGFGQQFKISRSSPKSQTNKRAGPKKASKYIYKTERKLTTFDIIIGWEKICDLCARDA